MAQTARATSESRHYNRQGLPELAKARKTEVGDRVMVKGQRVTPLTAKWDHHFIVTQVRGKVITVLHVPTGKTQRWNRNKIRIVDSEISWEGVRIRPRAQNIARPTTSTFTGAVRQQPTSAPLLPQFDEMAPLPEHNRKRAAPDTQHPLHVPKRHAQRAEKRPAPAESTHPMQLRKRGRWDDEKMDILCFCAQFFVRNTPKH